MLRQVPLSLLPPPLYQKTCLESGTGTTVSPGCGMPLSPCMPSTCLASRKRLGPLLTGCNVSLTPTAKTCRSCTAFGVSVNSPSATCLTLVVIGTHDLYVSATLRRKAGGATVGNDAHTGGARVCALARMR